MCPTARVRGVSRISSPYRRNRRAPEPRDAASAVEPGGAMPVVAPHAPGRTPRRARARPAGGSASRSGAASRRPSVVSVETMCEMIERRSASARSFGGLPWNVQPSWNAAPPAGTSIGTSSSSVAVRAGVAHVAEPVVGRVERAALAGARPVVGAADVEDRAGVGARVVERHPARRHVLRREELEVGGVLVAQQRLARRRLPDHVVLDQAQARAGRPSAAPNARDPLGQHRRAPASGRPSRRCRAGACGRAAWSRGRS